MRVALEGAPGRKERRLSREEVPAQVQARLQVGRARLILRKVGDDYLRPFQTETLAKTGDSVKQLMIAEYGLRAKNGLANAAVIGVKDA